MNKSAKGFTLLEIVLSSVIGAFVALIAVATLRTVIDARSRVEKAVAAADELRLAVNVISDDMACLSRDKKYAKFIGTMAGSDDDPSSSLVMRVVSTTNARPGRAEGDLYEVEYSLLRTEERSALLRRRCPILGIETEEESQGGILTTIAENVIDFKIQYFDGQEWAVSWPPEMAILPEIVEVTIMAAVDGIVEGVETSDPDAKKKVIAKTFTISFTRLPNMSLNQQYRKQVEEGTAGQEQEESSEEL